VFKVMNELESSQDWKRCPKCKKECLQILGYDPNDEGLEPLHKCTNCSHVSPCWQEAEKGGDLLLPKAPHSLR